MKLPFIPIKKQIVLPHDFDNIRVGKPNSIMAMEVAMAATSNKRKIAFTFIKEKHFNDDTINDSSQLEEYGVIAVIQKTSSESGVYKLTFDTKEPIKIKKLVLKNEKEEFSDNNPYLYLEYEPVKKQKEFNIESFKKSLDLLKLKTIEHKESAKGKGFGIIMPEKPTEINFKNFEQLGYIFEDYNNEDFAQMADIHIWDVIQKNRKLYTKEELLSLFPLSGEEIINGLTKIMSLRITSNQVDMELNKKLNEEMENSQRDFLLREKMKHLRSMLSDEKGENADALENDPEQSKRYPKYVLEALRVEQARLAGMMASSPEANVSKTFIELILKLPWRKVSKELIDINYVREILDKHHFGLEKPKERILEFISVLTHTKAQNPENEYSPIKGDDEHFIDNKLFVNKTGDTFNNPVNNIPILTLIGPPGTGKTTLAKSIAEALKRKFIKVSLGGVKDESEIRGHRRTYVGAMPGKIISAIKKAGVSNPVILLDEIDKMSSDFRGDPTSAMLEVLDPEQNANFQDHYLDLEYDLSKVLFIATANSYDSIPAPLIDRVELLELSTYTTREKLEIAKSHLMPKVISQNALKPEQIKLSDSVLEFIIRSYTRESGVRELKRILDNIARKIVVKILDKEVKNSFEVTKEIAIEFLGPIKFEDDENENKDQVGVVNGLAYTSFGGSTLAIEVTKFPGKEGLKLTGHLKDVMKESAQIALAYVRANATKFGIDFDFENNAIHIHVPAGAIPKDGPSAGVTFTTSIISALSNKKVPANIGMTGEITLRGKVLPIGGLKEKSLAACQYGIKKIFIPFENKKNLIDVPEEVKKEVTFVPVKYYEEIFNEIFRK
ncbi:endopeptidase La [Mycoplasma enhydrae]|uniref:endopeptidase La n=1 Tax=Mycoplasma enhydrae TaxID=2499220 RepID=UPI00197B44D3|nr:endopeptidase La [Mycoplasma enhydrae]MBN4089640.1 endopeptidase La [Mycoplasma enhydrae]